MAFSETWRVGFELELLLGDLHDVRFTRYADDPMDVASEEYCRAVAASLSQFTNRRWLAAHKKQRRTGYFVYSEYDLDPLDWPGGVVAGVELVTPPLLMDEAEALREEIDDWAIEYDAGINTYRNRYSLGSGWHINIDPGKSAKGLDVSKAVLCADELPTLLSALRYPSQYASPQRHSYGAPLLRYIRSEATRPLLERDLGNFLRHYGGRGKRYAMNLAKLEHGYLELRHFGSEWFFREQPLDQILSPFLAAIECTYDSHQLREERLLATFDLLAQWVAEFAPSISYAWRPPGSVILNMAFGEIRFEGELLADLQWSGTANYFMRLKSGETGPSIYDQAFPDLPLSLAVLALDLAEIRGRKLGKLQLANAAFSRAVDQLAKSLKRAGLLDPPPLEQSVYWTTPPYDPARVADETGLGRPPGG